MSVDQICPHGIRGACSTPSAGNALESLEVNCGDIFSSLLDCGLLEDKVCV